MTVETASYVSQLDTTLPLASDLISEGDNHLRLLKTVLKTQFPNFGTNAVTATAAELNYTAGLSASITSLLAAKGAIAGQAWTGAHDFTGASEVRAPTLAAGDNSTKVATTAYVASVALSSALPGQTGNGGKFITTDGTTANWSDTLAGNLKFSGNGRRIGLVGLSGGVTPSDGTLFESTSPDSRTSVGVKPNGAVLGPGAIASDYTVYNTDPSTNYSYGRLSIRNNDSVRIESGYAGSGVALPLLFDVDGITRLSIDTNLGRVGVNRTVATHLLHVDSAYAGGLPSTSNVSPDRNVITRFQNTGVAVDVGADNSATGWIQARSQSNNATNLPLLLNPNGGQVLAGVGGLGYGPGSVGTGGTVTQATSKSTAVTLNKPTGQITMNNAALAATTEVSFTLNNSLITNGDNLVVNGNGASNYTVRAGRADAGVCLIILRNNTAGSLSDAVIIDFKLIKGTLT